LFLFNRQQKAIRSRDLEEGLVVELVAVVEELA
jgi:hypothetical protein